MFKVNNLSNNVKEYVVAREIDGEFWFWGTYEEYSNAAQVAYEIDGTILHNSKII